MAKKITDIEPMLEENSDEILLGKTTNEEILLEESEESEVLLEKSSDEVLLEESADSETLLEEMGEKERQAEEEAKRKAAFKTYNGHECVDLGLPSGTLWATCNIGASKPEESGNYFSWGETTGYDEGKREFDDEHYKFRKKKGWLLTKWIFTKYVENKENGNVDNKLSLDKEDDAAYVQWGEGWRMPTTAQFEELINKDNTTQEFISKSGVKGLLITSKVNGICLFLPAADRFSYDWQKKFLTDDIVICHHKAESEQGNYWTRERLSGPCKQVGMGKKGVFYYETRKDHDHCANSFSFFISSLDSEELCCHISDNDYSDELRPHPTISRCFGYSIRPVRSK